MRSVRALPPSRGARRATETGLLPHGFRPGAVPDVVAPAQYGSV